MKWRVMFSRHTRHTSISTIPTFYLDSLMKRVIVILSMLICSAHQVVNGQSDNPDFAVLSGKTLVQDLTPYARISSGVSDSISVETFTSADNSIPFHQLAGASPPLQAHLKYWVRIPVLVMDDTLGLNLIVKTNLRFYHYYAQWDALDLYITDTSGHLLVHERGGMNIPRAQKSTNHPAGLSMVPLSFPGKGKYVLLLRLHHGHDRPAEELITIEARAPIVGLPKNSFGESLYVLTSISLVLASLSFFFFLFVRDKAYLYFFLYLLSLSLHYLILHPEIPFINWFIPQWPWLEEQAFMILTWGGFLFFMLFGRHFTDLPKHLPKIDRILTWVLLTASLITLLNILFLTALGRPILDPIMPVFIVAILAIVIRIGFIQSALAKIFVMGAAWLLVFTLAGMLFADQLYTIGINPWPIGQLGQMLIYMIGLAYKIRMNEQARAEAMRIREMDTIKSRFFANISHEFRTPLTLIQGMVQQIRGKAGALTDRHQEITISRQQTDVLERHSSRLLELVNQLLDLSRLDSGQMKLHLEKGDLIQHIKTLAHSFDTMAERKQIHFQLFFPEQHPIVYFDKDKLEKIFTNLLGNAFKYTPERGKVAVNVEVDEQRLRIRIEDNGPGIPRKEVDKVFDRFYRVEGKQDDGSGIGLALVKELVDLYHGQISVSSEPGKGTAFRFSLPVSAESFVPDDVILSGEPEIAFANNVTSAEESITGGDDLRPVVLVVEDNEDLQHFIRETLDEHYQVMTASNGIEGFESALHAIPDLIISDVMMPGMDGFECCAKLKQDERTSHIPVILLTAKAGQPHKLEGLATGADDYITKPFDLEELLVRVRNLIEGRKKLRQKFAGKLFIRPSEITVPSLDNAFLNRVMDCIEVEMHEETFGVEELSRAIGMSRSQLHRKLVALIDKTPSELIRQTRLLRAKSLLEKRSVTPAEVSYMVGFNSHSYFSKCFKEAFGISPSEV